LIVKADPETDTIMTCVHVMEENARPEPRDYDPPDEHGELTYCCANCTKKDWWRLSESEKDDFYKNNLVVVHAGCLPEKWI